MPNKAHKIMTKINKNNYFFKIETTTNRPGQLKLITMPKGNNHRAGHNTSTNAAVLSHGKRNSSVGIKPKSWGQSLTMGSP